MSVKKKDNGGMTGCKCNPDDMSVHMLISDISKITRSYAHSPSLGLNLAQSFRNILFFLCHKDGLTQLELSNLTHLKPPTVSVTLRKMEQEGYVTREDDANDHRQTHVYVTPKGRAFDEKIKNAYEFQNELICKALTESEYRELKRLLIKARNAVVDSQASEKE